MYDIIISSFINLFIILTFSFVLEKYKIDNQDVNKVVLDIENAVSKISGKLQKISKVKLHYSRKL